MKEILTRNLGLKIASVVIGFLIWLAVVNVSDPLITRTKEVPLDVINVDVMKAAGLAYELENKRTSVTITYKIHTQDQSLIQAADFKAYVDLADYYPATGTVPVYVEVSKNKDYLVESVAAKPAVVRVRTEQIQKKDFDLVANQEGFPQNGYEVERVSLSPSMVTVEGPESVIGRISTVGVKINVEGIRSETVGAASPTFYDANGNEINLDDRVAVNVQEISYQVSVVKIQEVKLEFNVGGEVADSCRYMGLESSADTVAVMGPEASVAALESIRIPASVLNLDGADEDKVIIINVEDFLPDKEKMSIPVNNQVTVTLKVEKLEQKTLEISTNRIITEGESNENHYGYDRDSIEVVVQGRKEELDRLEASDIIMEMDVSDMDVGMHRGVLEFDGLEDDCEVLRYSDFLVIVTSRSMGPGVVTLPETEEETVPELSETETSPEETLEESPSVEQ